MGTAAGRADLCLSLLFPHKEGGLCFLHLFELFNPLMVSTWIVPKPKRIRHARG
jgi:hypothetical protein